jgi:two-component system, NarL family, nitrate/nitrite response regulator NarL
MFNSLTRRDLETRKLIARELDITDGMLKVHVKHLLKKLNMHSRVEATAWIGHQQKG